MAKKDHTCNEDDVRTYDVYNTDETEYVGKDKAFHCSVCGRLMRTEWV